MENEGHFEHPPFFFYLYTPLAVGLEWTTLVPGQTGGGEDFQVEVFPHLQQGNVVLQSSN